ncbi:MAG: hypothetical protein ACOYL3_29235 [Desulfuromonadaceae bacterium]
MSNAQQLNISADYAPQRQHSEMFIRGEDGYLNYYYFENNSWKHDGESFKAAKVDGSITAVFAPQRNHTEVFFKGDDGYLQYYYVPEGGGWTHDGVSFKAAKVAGAISAVFAPQRHHSEVFFQGDDGYPHYFFVPLGGGWTHQGIANQNIFSGGYYNLDIPGLGWAQHTYVIADYHTSNEVKFPCYGDTDTEHKLDGSIYPTTLYKPDLLPPYTKYGTDVNGNLLLARGIACGDISAAPRSTYNLKTGGSYLFGDCCGLVYAINGVCHHMEARILWACNNTPIIWPPTVTLSFWVWYDINMLTGFYGNSWFIWKPVFEQMKKKTKTRMAYDIQNLIRESVKEALKQPDKLEIRAVVMDQAKLVNEGETTTESRMNTVADQMIVFHQFKKDLDTQLLKGAVTKEEYAEQVNKKFKETMTEFANVLNEKDFQNLFGIAPGGEYNLGIDSKMIPDNLLELKLID